MLRTIIQQEEKLMIPFTKEQYLAVEFEKLGYTMEQNIRLQFPVPCFLDGKTPLLVDAMVLNDEGEALVMVLCGFPLDDEKQLRLLADIYSNSAKQTFGQRPVVVFLTDGKCKIANSLLGGFDTEAKPLPKAGMQEFVAIHNIQEKVLFEKLLSDSKMLEQFLTNQLDTVATNALLEAELDKAKAVGFSKYFREICPDAKSRRVLYKQAAMLAGVGEENYRKLSHTQMALVQTMLMPRCQAVLRAGAVRKNWLKIEQHTTERRMQEWAFGFLGWDIGKDIQQNVSVPCYYNPKMQLLADYAFLDPLGKPVLLFLQDELNLAPDRAFVCAEFYARSFKAVYGIAPMVLFYRDGVARMKVGALSGGFETIRQVLPQKRLVTQTAIVNVTEDRAWKALMPHIPELQGIFDQKKRTEKQLEYVRASAEDTKAKLSDRAFLTEAFETLRTSTQLLEEDFWKTLLGEDSYQASREEELKLIRTFVADKRIAAGVLD